MSTQEEDVYDVIIVGAGPCGLATAARLRERTPAALFTDEEHRRLSWINKHGHGVSLKHVRSGKVTPARTARSTAEQDQDELRMLVLDASGDKWMSRWKRLFKTYDISHLRSHMLWHIDPQDRDALLAYTYDQHREKELIEMKNCVGKEVSKHAKKKIMGSRACGSKQENRVTINLRERNDYYRPSQSLFCEHCDEVAKRYRLGTEMIRNESLQDLDYGVVQGVSVGDEKLFTVTTPQGRRFARAVILAVGPANVPRIPKIPSMPDSPTGLVPHACHSMEIQEFPASIVTRRIEASRPTNIVVIGGGLTSAQLTDLAIRRGVTKVFHLMRGPCRVKHFDVDLQWMGKYKNAEQARFWLADSDQERLDMIKEARGGGSLTPTFHKRLKQHSASGRLALHTKTCLIDARFDEEQGLWHIKTDPPIADLPPMDYMYFATGIQSDYASLPYLQTRMEKYPIQGYGGFPCLNDDLMWKDGVPLFLVGRLAALKLGPAAPNIGGAKVGAERVAWAIEDLLGKGSGNEDGLAGQQKEAGGGGTGMFEYLSGHHNMYSALACE